MDHRHMDFLVTDACHHPLHVAASAGDTALVRDLVVHQGFSANVNNFDRVTPLHEAAVNGHADCIRVLIENGAKVNAQNIDGSTPLCDACAKGSIECARMLIEAGATINPQLLSTSPLHEAAMRGNVECTALLVSFGAKLEANDCHLGTPLHTSCHNNHVECARTLIAAGANVNATKHLQTPLHYAVHNSNVELVILLLDSGASTSKREFSGKTPLELCRREEVREIIRKHNANPRTLAKLCRLVIRENLNHRGFADIDALCLPLALKMFLLYQH